jgi:prepilin peptidase CpaA
MISAVLLSLSVKLYLALLLLAASWDFAWLRIPNFLSSATAALFVAYGTLALGPVDWAFHIAAAAGALIIGVVMFSSGLIGGGDVKLLTVVVLWTDPTELLTLLSVMTTTGAALAFLLVSVRPAVQRLLSFLPPDIPSRYIPKSLLSGAGIPYGVPIAVAAIAAILH